ncbi:hypothetical protein L249_7678 [Ophiocordyceps polyrhachis-furcata BCC 54312]|uniref:tRNA dimethylallyltransferase n=1 Tax=Ophiocordyceps polyrhachis-furcata BCC 54312 TaxID=1330021 RepID=A0A367LBF3_9HYPO|nr:hypothetical protein L249_7678 [Ophiocordyceps polyrhachis-furcata BCC 54312]
MTPARNPPTKPLLVVLGSTGTGKSDLAVDLASRFDGEIINADAMQLYKGLPILTNKMNPSARRGIPHHLLGHIPPLSPPWNVDVFRREASLVLEDIRSRGKLPILVGGTHYYLDALLFPDVVLDSLDQRDGNNHHHDHHPHHGLLDEPTHILLAELRKCDPAMAERWHPNDRRKILRSLEIFLNTGRTATALYAEQEQRRRAAHQNVGPWDKLLFWVHTDRDVLCHRLDRRVDAMLEAGLLDEVRQLYALRREALDPSSVDVTKGIWQSIGYRQFEPYVHDTASSPALKATALEEVKAATRRYAAHQTRWIRYKQTRRLRDQGPEAISSLYLVDSTDPALFRARVLDPAASLVDQFLRGLPRPSPADLSPRAREILAAAWHPPDPPEPPRKHFCDLCQATLLSDEAWRRHIGGIAHRRATVKKKKLALVSCEPQETTRTTTKATTPEAEDRSSSPDITSLF